MRTDGSASALQIDKPAREARHHEDERDLEDCLDPGEPSVEETEPADLQDVWFRLSELEDDPKLVREEDAEPLAREDNHEDPCELNRDIVKIEELTLPDFEAEPKPSELERSAPIAPPRDRKVIHT